MVRCKVYPTIRTVWRTASLGGKHGQSQNWAVSDIMFETKAGTDKVLLDVEVDDGGVAHILIRLPDDSGEKTVFFNFTYLDGKLYVDDIFDKNYKMLEHTG